MTGRKGRDALADAAGKEPRQKGEESFLSRWARRKQAAQRQGDLVRDVEADEGACAREVAPDAARRPASPLESGSMQSDDDVAAAWNRTENDALKEAEEPPVPEDLAGIDPQNVDPRTLDYNRLMRDDVPEGLRRRLLRRLWQSDETLANLDGLNDYDEDFTSAGIAAAAHAFFQRIAAIGEQERDARSKIVPEGDERERRKVVTPSSSSEASSDPISVTDAGSEKADLSATALPPRKGC